MAINKNALIRYKTIDKCLQNRHRKWTMQDLIEACSDALYEYEGRDTLLSRRTIQMDIQMMRSDKLSYNAPIVVYDKKYYTYSEPDYSINNIPLGEAELNVLQQSILLLKQFKDFSLFSEMDGILKRLEDIVYTERKVHRPIIHIDKNEKLKGLEFLEPIYQYIVSRSCLTITYQSFKHETTKDYHLSPYLLKEYNNRWFLIGKQHNRSSFTTLALDRIVSIAVDENNVYKSSTISADEYFKHSIGVSIKSHALPETIDLFVYRPLSPYISTKPIHHSQELIAQNEEGIHIRLTLILNFELKRLILGMGSAVKIIGPTHLKEAILEEYQKSQAHYKG